MDPTLILEADHRMVERLIDEISDADGDERTRLVEQLRTVLEAHMELEEEVVYPAMQPVTGEEMVQEGVQEHILARTNLAEVVELCPDKPGFEAALETVQAAIDHHVSDEEDEVFVQLRSEGRDQLAAMVEPFMAKRAQLDMVIDVEGLADSASRDQLQAEAESLGLDTTSSMSKADLAGALAGSYGET